MTISAGMLITWGIIGLLGGTAAGVLLSRNRQGFGLWQNLLIGVAGAFVGGLIFNLLNINIAPGVVVSLNDVIAALVGAVVLVLAWRFVKQGTGRRRKKA